MAHRAHIHLVACVETTAAQAGVRESTDTIVRVDARRYISEGNNSFWSNGGILLTAGPISPQYIVDTAPRPTSQQPKKRPAADAPQPMSRMQARNATDNTASLTPTQSSNTLQRENEILFKEIVWHLPAARIEEGLLCEWLLDVG